MTHTRRSAELLGGLSRPIQPGRILAPRLLRVEGDYLIYSLARGNAVSRPAGPDLLRRFLALESAAAPAVADFAARYGVPVVCDHGLALHDARQRAAPCAPPDPPDLRSPRRQSVQGILRLAAVSAALIRIAAEVHQRSAGRREDWAVWVDYFTAHARLRLPAGPSRGQASQDIVRGGLAAARTHLAFAVQFLVQEFEVRPGFTWDAETQAWRIDMVSTVGRDYSNIPGLLVAALLPLLADSQGYAVCSACHMAYVPARTPAFNRRCYCPRPECQRARWRDAQRDRRAGIPPRWRRS